MNDYDRWHKLVLEMPPWKVFESRTKKESPFDKFHLWIAAHLGGVPRGKRINVTATLLRAEDNERLFDLTVAWAMRLQNLRRASARSAVMSLNLEIGPAVALAEEELPNWLQPGFAYVDTHVLFREPHPDRRRA